MVIRNDYLLQMIERFARAIAAALQKRQQGQVEEANAELNELCHSLVGMPISDAVRFDTDTLLNLTADPESGLALAHLLKAYGARRRAFLVYDRLEQRGDLPEGGIFRKDFTELVEDLA